MLIDLHAHTGPLSVCCRASAPDIVRIAKENGIDGFALTNHYVKQNDGDHTDFALRYVNEYYYTKGCGDMIGCLVIYGMEITMERCNGAHILVYGVEPSFTLAHPLCFNYTMEELYRAVKAENGMIVQAHPFRNGQNKLQDLSYLDGVELSSHPMYDGTYAEKLTEIAHKNGIILTSGGDYHADVPYRPYCGLHLPENIRDTRALADYLMTTEGVDVQYREPYAPEGVRMTYRRHEK